MFDRTNSTYVHMYCVPHQCRICCALNVLRVHCVLLCEYECHFIKVKYKLFHVHVNFVDAWDSLECLIRIRFSLLCMYHIPFWSIVILLQIQKRIFRVKMYLLSCSFCIDNFRYYVHESWCFRLNARFTQIFLVEHFVWVILLWFEKKKFRQEELIKTIIAIDHFMHFCGPHPLSFHLRKRKKKTSPNHTHTKLNFEAQY